MTSDSLERLSRQTLNPIGWTESVRQKLPVDKNGAPLPWWTYPAIEFVAEHCTRESRVFEYGCGHSTLWWQRNVKQVISVDHDKAWVEKISDKISLPNQVIHSAQGDTAPAPALQLTDNYMAESPRSIFGYDAAKMTRRGLNDQDFVAYANQINQSQGKFDFIVIDGMARRLCARFAPDKLAPNGIIIFDNSNRSDYQEGYQHLISRGFYQIRFSGMVPGINFPTCTSIFLKNLGGLSEKPFQKSYFGLPEY